MTKFIDIEIGSCEGNKDAGKCQWKLTSNRTIRHLARIPIQQRHEIIAVS